MKLKVGDLLVAENSKNVRGIPENDHRPVGKSIYYVCAIRTAHRTKLGGKYTIKMVCADHKIDKPYVGRTWELYNSCFKRDWEDMKVTHIKKEDGD